MRFRKNAVPVPVTRDLLQEKQTEVARLARQASEAVDIVTLAWASRLGILRCWILLSLDWTTWLKSVVFTLSPSIP